jgi:myosin-1
VSDRLFLSVLFQNAMQIVGFMEDEVQLVLELVAAVLKLGNIEFKPESRVNGFDESRVKDKNGETMV